LIDRIDFVIQSCGCAFLGIKIYDIDSRLMLKLNIVHEARTIVDTPKIVSLTLSGGLMISFAEEILSRYTNEILGSVMSGESDLSNILRTLTEIYSRGCKLDQAACRLLTLPLCSTPGSIKASEDIHRNSVVSSEALTWHSVGLNSDAASSRLKLASLVNCSVGDMNTMEIILRQIEEQYHMDIV
jgi:hypothetical protein